MRRLLPYFLLVIGSSAASFAQTAAPPNAVKLTKYILGVADLDKSVAFYRALRIELDGAAAVGKPQPLPESLLKLVDVPKGTKFRNAMMKIPGADFALELTEFTGMEVHAGRPRIQDPGASLLTLWVRDAAAALSTAKSAGARVVTIGGTPIAKGNGFRTVIVSDPDGFFVEFEERQAAATVQAGNISGGEFGSFVEDIDRSVKFYQDKFGFDSQVRPQISEVDFLKIGGLTSGELHRGRLTVPGSPVRRWAYEIRGVDRKPYRLRIPDPGAPAIGLEVRDLDAAAAAFKAAGGSVITQGGSIQLPNGDKLAFMRDPSGILVEVAQPAAKK